MIRRSSCAWVLGVALSARAAAAQAPAWELSIGNAVRGLAVSGNVLLAGADLSGKLTAIDLTTGRALWSAKLPTSIHNDPAVSLGGAAVVTYGDLPAQTSPGGAWAFDVRTGHVLWKFESHGALMPAAALVGDGAVLTASDGCVYGLSMMDGRQRFRVCIAASSSMSNPRRNGPFVYFGTIEGKVVSIDARDGYLKWIQPVPNVTFVGDATAEISGDALFITGTQWGGISFALHDTSFAVAMRRFADAVVHEPWVLHRSFFARQYVASLSLSDGSLRWITQIGAGPRVRRNQAGSPIVAGNLIVVGSPVGVTLTALHRESGRKVWQVALPARHRGAPTIWGDMVLVGLESEQLLAVSIRDGSTIGSCRWPGAFTPSSPLIAQGSLIYGAADGVLRAVPLEAVALRLRRGGSCTSD
jgi:outer membrane protein assembly factor BamB